MRRIPLRPWRALEQLTVDGWKPIAFASRFLNSCEERYSVIELELLGVVWSTEYFKNYLYGKQFNVITDHRALLSIMKEHRSNKSYYSRLTRWVDRLLPFQFDIENLPGAKMGLVDYISRNSSQRAKKVSAYDEEFIVAKLKLISKSINALELNITHPASHLHRLLANHTLALQNTPKIEAHDFVSQIKPKVETSTKSINSISTHTTRVNEHVFSNSLAPRKQASKSICELSNLKYAIPASQNTTYFSTIDLRYAYSQLNLDANTANHCNFNIISGDMTGIYRFQTRFYGLTDMPAEFQKAMDYTLIGLQNTYCFLDDILIVSKGSLTEHKSFVMKCLQRLDDKNLRINLPKSHFGKLEIDWLGYHISQLVISALETKTAAILALEAPKTLKKLRSFLGSVHYIGKFIPNLAQISHPLRPLLKKSSKFIWTAEHENCFIEIKNRIANATANSHYNPQLETRVKCDASRSGLGAALEQLTVDGWKPIAFASRFLKSCEERYSVNELELFGVFWSTENFKNYLYGKHFKVITDHPALI